MNAVVSFPSDLKNKETKKPHKYRSINLWMRNKTDKPVIKIPVVSKHTSVLIFWYKFLIVECSCAAIIHIISVDELGKNIRGKITSTKIKALMDSE